MKKFLSLILATTMLITMPGFSVGNNFVETKAAEISASGDFTSGNYVGNNLSFVDDSNPNYESYTYKTVKGGVSGRTIPVDKYGYFKVTNNAVTQNDNNLFIEVTFYDEGSNSFQIQYNSTNGNYRAANIGKTNSNTWVTTTVCLDDASLKKAQNGGCDFRIWGQGEYGTTISKISITKQAVNPDGEPLGERTGGNANSEFKGKSFAGYQGWFGTGGRYNSWQHYAYGSAEPDGTRWPRANNISIDFFPDVTEYADSSLAQTGFDNLGNGKETKLFDSNETDVINTHFRWMKEYGIDGAAIQRFVGGLAGRTITKNPESSQLSKIQRAAEKNNVLTYVMYDISGGQQISDANDTTSISSYVKDMKFDWVYNIEQSQKMLNSPSYATVNGKPVVCVWGFGFDNAENTRPSRRADYQEIINFFHQRGCYVIIGVPRDWRSQSKYIDIYNKADMISPWYVGGLGADEGSVDSMYNNFLKPDLEYCKNNNMDFYPVVFSGFSWTLWQGGKPNMIARNAGQTFWNQAYKLKQIGLDSFYVAMFDEYDEGTAVAKMASDYFDIPKDQYFVTASCDGYWLSSDFQLRVVKEAINMMKGKRAVVKNVPVEHSLGPVYYRNSFESKYVTCKETQYNGVYPVDPCFKNQGQLYNSNVSATTAIEKTDKSKSGDYAAAIQGNAYASDSSYIYRISETKIKIRKGMKLSYSVYAENELGRNTYVELICSDGTYISTTGVMANGVSMGKGSAKGTVGSYRDYTFTFGSAALEGKEIVGIALAYAGNAGNFKAYYDNIIIENGDGQVEVPTTPETTTEQPTAAKKCDLVITELYTDKTYYAGDEVQFVAKIKNIGDGTSPSETKHGLAISVDGSVKVWCDTFFGPLAPGEEAILVANGGPDSKGTWTATGGTHNVTAMIDDVALIDESNEENNTIEKTMTFNSRPVETTKDETTASTGIITSDRVSINGFQISATVNGSRTIYSVENTINGKQVVGEGLVYALSDYAKESDMYVGSDAKYVKDFAATSVGKLSINYSGSSTSTSYAMTMKFAAATEKELNANWKVRAYVKLADGTYVYSKVVDYTIYKIAENLYRNTRMNTIEGHNYLYNNIILKVNKDYKEVDYDWGNTIVPVG